LTLCFFATRQETVVSKDADISVLQGRLVSMEKASFLSMEAYANSFAAKDAELAKVIAENKDLVARLSATQKKTWW
jgi:hypothetical protein